MLGRTLRVAGELGGEGSVEMLREAYTLLGPTVARYELACAELALARVTATPQEREPLLRAALDRAATCGSPGLYRQAADELVAAGAGPPPPFEDVLTLTATERRVAELAAAGSSASVIAQSLFVTPATVEGSRRRRQPARGPQRRRARRRARHRLTPPSRSQGRHKSPAARWSCPDQSHRAPSKEPA